jgi:hypothetical protein
MKDIPDYNGDYAVDDSGNVYSLKFSKCRKLSPRLDGHGYHHVILYKDGKMKTHKVHRLVAQAFLDDYSEDLDVDHIDGDKQNNQIWNLRMVTHQQNHFNRTTAKGYYWNKNKEKWQAQIKVNYKTKNLGYFDTEAEARDAYLTAKKILHII